MVYVKKMWYYKRNEWRGEKMLIYYRFHNFCSFYCDNEFSMSAPGGKVMRRFPENYVEFEDGFHVLKTAVIVGENAGGKSNFINSLKYLKSLLLSNSRVKSFRPYMNTMCLEDTECPYQEFEICFRTESGNIYIYHLMIDECGVVKEKLEWVKKKNQKASVIFSYERMEKDSFNGQADRSAKERLWQYVVGLHAIKGIQLNSSGLGLGLTLTKFALLDEEHAMEAVKWLTETLCPENVDTRDLQDVMTLEEDLNILRDDRYLDIFRMVDYSICGLEIDAERPYTKSVIIRKNEQGNVLRRELELDSAGVREFFIWAIQIYKVVYENKVVFADEMDRVLNPVLSDRVAAFINGTDHQGQFIFTTHNVLHLDLKIYMKEQIYFITKNKENLTSEIYSLSDFPEVRYETTKIYEFYMKGILGGTTVE